MRVAIITARGGSSRIPKKNSRMFHGKPIIAYSIETAKAAKFDSVVVSTDSDEIRDIAWQFGATYLEREPALAQNEIGTRAVMARAVEQLELNDTDEVACIYPTAPMLEPENIHQAAWLLIMRPAYFVVTVGTAPLCDAGALYYSFAGHWKQSEEDMPIYGIRTAYLPLSPARVCDINTEEDWARAEIMYEDLRRENHAKR